MSLLTSGIYSNGEIESFREMAEDAPLLFTFTRYDARNTNLDVSGHVAEQIVAYRLKKLRNAARRLEETYARAAAQADCDTI